MTINDVDELVRIGRIRARKWAFRRNLDQDEAEGEALLLLAELVVFTSNWEYPLGPRYAWKLPKRLAEWVRVRTYSPQSRLHSHRVNMVPLPPHHDSGEEDRAFLKVEVEDLMDRAKLSPFEREAVMAPYNGYGTDVDLCKKYHRTAGAVSLSRKAALKKLRAVCENDEDM